MNGHDQGDACSNHAATVNDGLTRWRWPLHDFLQLQSDPRFDLSHGVELIGGELIAMSAKTERHEVLRVEIANRLARQLPQHMRVMTGLGWQPGDGGYYEPDLVVFELSGNPAGLSGAAMALVIEIGIGQMLGEINTKAALYAALGVRDYWVVQAQTLETRIYRAPTANGFGRLKIVSSGAAVTPLALPQIEMKFSTFGLGSL